MALTEQFVRFALQDRSPDDHILHTDVVWSSEDIAMAMQLTAMRFNSIRPYGMTVSASSLPSDTTLFLDGVLGTLYETKRNNLALNSANYQLGDVSANTTGDLLNALGALAKEYSEKFRQGATELKRSMNFQSCFGVVG